MTIAAAVVVLIASIVGFWLALPLDGEVREFLRNDNAQAYYTLAIIAGFAGGLLYTVLGLISLFS